MKYEPVFGPQELFDGAPDDAEMAYETANHVRGYYKKCNSLKFFSNSKWVRVLNEKAMIIHAMRRIIKEPKCWTWEDKKAGRLPEVGAEVQFNFYQSAVVRQGIIKYIDEQVAVIQTEDVTRPFCYETCKVVFTPLETPEEKAERLRSEWIQQSCYDLVQPTEKAKELAGFIYDALLSGALSVPTKGGE